MDQSNLFEKRACVPQETAETCAWDEMEAEWFESLPARQQAVQDRKRIQGYMLACARETAASRVALEEAGDALERARLAAEEARKRFQFWLEQAELVADVIATDDTSWNAEVAMCLENLVG